MQLIKNAIYNIIINTLSSLAVKVWITWEAVLIA